MKTGIIYWHPSLYRNAIRFFLYGSGFKSRYSVLAGLLPCRTSVIDICCGDCYILKFLKDKKIDYLGLDLSPTFVRHAVKKGIKAKIFDVTKNELPKADYVIMQGSLYQFIPDEKSVLDKMFRAAEKAVIISEPVKHVASGSNPIMSFLSNMATRVNGKVFKDRFSKKGLLDLFNKYNVTSVSENKNGIDLIGLFIKKPGRKP